jgi:hypothetical protein
MPAKRKSSSSAAAASIPAQPPVLTGQDAGPVRDFDSLLGEGADLWADDAEFAAFLAALRHWRKQEREESPRP